MKRALLIVLLAACGPAEEFQADLAVPAPEQQVTQQKQPVLTELPCDVRDVVQTACVGCHSGDNPVIVTIKTRDQMLALKDRLQDRLTRDPLSAPMPPRLAARQLTSDERALLTGWIAQGLPAGECTLP